MFTVELLGAFQESMKAAMVVFGDRMQSMMATVDPDVVIQTRNLLNKPPRPPRANAAATATVAAS